MKNELIPYTEKNRTLNRKHRVEKKRDQKQKIAYEVLIFLCLLGLFVLITRVWVLVLFVVLGIFIAALRLLFLRFTEVEIIEMSPIPVLDPKPETEKDLLRRAYALIEKRITEDVLALHPSARWYWLNANAISSIERDDPVTIILNNAGGYKKALVQIHNLVFKGLVYETVENTATESKKPDAPDPVSGDTESQDSESQDSDEQTNYELLAFEWVDSHLLELNNRGNEAIGSGQSVLVIFEDELPIIESWRDICKELIQNGFHDAVPNDTGIIVSLQQ